MLGREMPPRVVRLSTFVEDNRSQAGWNEGAFSLQSLRNYRLHCGSSVILGSQERQYVLEVED